MSLKKLWNSLRGGSSEPKSPVKASAETPAPVPIVSPASTSPPTPTATTPQAKQTPRVERVEPKVEPVSNPVAKVAPPRRSILSLRSRGEHDGLLKMISQTRPSSILEIGVGDGSRMPAILASIAQSGVEPGTFKAIVIDEFEMAGGEVTMRDYHRQLAGLPIRPVIFPEPVARGLVNVAHRFGAVDMVLVDASMETVHAEGLATYLGKVSHGNTMILSNAGGKWTARQRRDDLARRAA